MGSALQEVSVIRAGRGNGCLRPGSEESEKKRVCFWARRGRGHARGCAQGRAAPSGVPMGVPVGVLLGVPLGVPVGKPVKRRMHIKVNRNCKSVVKIRNRNGEES